MSLVYSACAALSAYPVLLLPGREFPIDVVILATGFDVMSAQLDLTGRDGLKLREHVKSKQASEIYHGVRGASACCRNFSVH